MTTGVLHTQTILLATDIFGRTPAIDQFAQAVSASGVLVKILSPYGNINREFSDEDAAYKAFLQECGHARYTQNVLAEIEAQQPQTVIVGFSAGASAAWNASGKKMSNSVKHIIGFYPSQIRNALHIIPSCQVTLIFPCREEHFDVDTIIHQVSQRESVKCVKTAYLHGFMNPLSRNYSSNAAKRFTRTLAQPKTLVDATIFRRLVRDEHISSHSKRH